MGVARLVISVSDISVILASFNVIRVKRSTTTEDGVYSLLTANAPIAATLTAPNAGNYTVAGLVLQLEYDSSAQIDVTFTGGAPLTAADVAAQINTAVGVVVAYDDAGTLRLTSPTTGTISRVEIIGGSSLTEFGWTAGDRDIGEDAHVLLQADQSLYNYQDNDGSGDYYYKVQYFNTSNNLASADSDAFKGEPGTIVGAENLSLAKVDLVDGSGIAVSEQDITLWSVYEVVEVDAFVAGIQRKPIATITTDSAGHAEILLVRGLRVKVVFEGTSIIREFVVPDTDEFDLLDELSDSPDPFDVKEPDYNLALRRTL
jgi:hypothetical protein